jgi:hypothetical protein
MQVLDYIGRAVLHIPQHKNSTKKVSEENAGGIQKKRHFLTSFMDSIDAMCRTNYYITYIYMWCY